MNTVATANGQGKLKHPKGLYLLFVTEMWERYSYYGMRAVLVLYLTTALISGGLGMDPGKASLLYGYYTGMVYLTPIIGGWLTDRFISMRTAITIGGVTMAIGDFSLFLINAQWGVYLGLILLIIGNGFFKPNISTLVGELYSKNDVRKDSAFTIFYMGINLGALFSPLIAGMIYQHWAHSTTGGIEHFGFKYAFLASSIGMIVGQLGFNILGKKFLGDAGTKPAKEKVKPKKTEKAKPLTKVEKRRVVSILILACFVIAFWAGFEQAGSSFTLYTQKFIDRDVNGFIVPTSWFQSLNPLFILILAPIMSALWVKLAKSKRGDFGVPTKMAFGLILLGLGFFVLVPAVMQTGSDEAHIVVKANLLFMVFTYLLHTLGELCLSPVGLSAVSKLAPVKIASLMMGIWFISNSVANMIAGKIAEETQKLGYLGLYQYTAIAVIILGIILLALSKPIQKLMHLDKSEV
ncbi:POT family proton-dependent oligopeptide transporter [Scopulibacillus darangshiensis]|uniref:POT family proton-dependent oligopeptide transporter n=1 Tax=Scopulibacillus darangshiensis TaxID=442528 RepID=A0A4R2PAI1_9BACL|nr:peptide MFS transporter [Scopulibacillus darangshiensis]TCP31284.1 POT family proton-dependent oligopeptide transporter [Scopulibacillus darangshiensis]